MRNTSTFVMSGLALVALMTVVLLPAQVTGAASITPRQPPITEVNRTAKGDRLAEPRSIAVKKPAPVMPKPLPTGQSDKRELMEGCESSFSPVTNPSMAHVAGRCIG